MFKKQIDNLKTNHRVSDVDTFGLDVNDSNQKVERVFMYSKTTVSGGLCACQQILEVLTRLKRRHR